MKMLKLILCLLGCLFSLSIEATDKADLNDAVSMVSYEQRWLDYNGTIALKNNTGTDIHNVNFIITYLDMSDQPLDYEEYTVEVDIAPGMTKKVDIPAYEHDRSYSYYKSEASPSEPHRFKIKYELKGYNIQNPDKVISDDEDLSIYDENFEPTDFHPQDNIGWYVFLVIIVSLFILGIGIGLYVLVAVMAKKRNRNVVLWILLSLVGTPLLMIIILLCIGDADDDSDNFS